MKESWTEQNWLDFAGQLDNFYAWPTLYTFKFIVKAGKEEELRKLFPLHTDNERPSKNGNYTSVTFQMMMNGSQAVIDVYKKAAVIEGIIAL